MSTPNPDRVAAVQMVSGPDVAANLAAAEALVGQAVAQGASLVVLPENFGIIATSAAAKVAAREPDGDGPQQRFLARMATVHGVTIIGGSVPLESGDPARAYQSLLVYAPGGQRVARYDKMHLFRFTHGDEDYDEARTIRAGEAPQVFDAPLGRVGLSICYDVRFPELYRALGPLTLIVVPAAFTERTGRAHWDILLRARAVENQCYVLAAAQGGEHEGGRRTYGHSMLVDPWGEIVRTLTIGPGVVVGDIDHARIDDVRARLPALAHRVLGA
ncbi:MAG TPA: carbon-nitrogen hydrolase family protein [Casimicrobiaceae bacterium]|nr:carbon-nitrogen hydrolase family protein [Casimicrobiaceae bacterium]